MTGKTAEERAEQRSKGRLNTKLKVLEAKEKHNALCKAIKSKFEVQAHTDVGTETILEQDLDTLGPPAWLAPRRKVLSKKTVARLAARTAQTSNQAAICLNATSDFAAANASHANNLLFLSQQLAPTHSALPSVAMQVAGTFALRAPPTASFAAMGSLPALGGGQHDKSENIPSGDMVRTSLFCFAEKSQSAPQQLNNLQDHSKKFGISAMQPSVASMRASDSSVPDNQHPPEFPRAPRRVQRQPTTRQHRPASLLSVVPPLLPSTRPFQVPLLLDAVPHGIGFNSRQGSGALLPRASARVAKHCADIASLVTAEASLVESIRLEEEENVARARNSAIAVVTAAAQAARDAPSIAADRETSAPSTVPIADPYSSSMMIDDPADSFQDLDEDMFDVVNSDIDGTHPGNPDPLPDSAEQDPIAAADTQATGHPPTPATFRRNDASANRAGRRMFSATTESWPDEPMSPRCRDVFLGMLAGHRHIAAGVAAFISKPVAMAVSMIDKFRQVIAANPVHPGGQNRDVSSAINTALRFVGDETQAKAPQAAFLGVTVPRFSQALAHSEKRKHDQMEESDFIAPLSASYHNCSTSLQERWTRYKYASDFWISAGQISPSKRDFSWQSTPQEPVGWV